MYLAEHGLVGTFQLGTTGRNTLKYPNTIDNNQWKELEKEGRKKGINTSDTKEVFHCVGDFYFTGHICCSSN